MSKIIRSLAITARIVDEASGLVDFIASTPTVDSYGESIAPDGFDISSVETNLPLVDSHDYSSVRTLIGCVVKCWTQNKSFMCRAKLAIDVQENDLAKLAFAMLKAGYLRACSVGFMPLQVLGPTDEGYDEECERLGVEKPSLIYTSCKLMELSLCCIGANPDAVTASASAAGLSRKALENLQTRYAPAGARQTQTDMKRDLVNLFLKSPVTTPAQAEDKLLTARAGQSESELLRSFRSYRRAVRHSKHMQALDLIRARLEAEPEIRELVKFTARYFSEAGHLRKLFSDETNARAEKLFAARALSEAGGLGAATIPIPIADLILDLTALTGVAEQSLGVVDMPGGITKLPRKTANPVALCFTQADQSYVPAVDATLTGSQLTESAVTIAVLLNISEELIADQKADATAAFLLACAQAIAFRFDYCSFAGNGVDDQTNGGMIGLYNAGGITAYNAAAGNTTLTGLQRQDFLGAVAALSPVAIQRGVSAWTHPSFVPLLMTIAQGPSGQFLIKTPMENESGEWSVCGFPLFLTTAAPWANPGAAPLPGTQAMLFGYGPAYQVGLRDGLEIRSSQDVYFDKNLRGVFVSRRGCCGLQDATQFCILKLAQQ